MQEEAVNSSLTRKKILVTGANGQLGKELRQLYGSFPQFEFIFLSREDLPIHHFELVRNFFHAYHPHYCINCAAYTAVDRAETEKELAFQVNAEAVGVLAAVCKEQECRFLHVSTDYVFDGNANHPYQEGDPVNPQSVYGASKLEGENQALTLNPDSIIIRTSWVYSSFGKNFVKTMLKLMNEKNELNVVNDQQGSPTYAADLAAVIMHIVNSGKWQAGIYHFCNEGIISWYDFAVAIKDMSGSSCSVHPIPSHQYPTPARRPGWSVLNTRKIQQQYQVQMKHWKISLAECLQKLGAIASAWPIIFAWCDLFFT
ncbi:MAG TPA: dTDP-4-dehydrorhamnose reductase [Chitinophagaceae bacterium]|nr:dTDP-4-dehydrorhamnose reductase [Chitinophagaceae bacterium]